MLCWNGKQNSIFLHCPYFTNVGGILMNKLDEINNSIISKQPTELIRIILHGDCKLKHICKMLSNRIYLKI